jgi:hypothetical protein
VAIDVLSAPLGCVVAEPDAGADVAGESAATGIVDGLTSRGPDEVSDEISVFMVVVDSDPQAVNGQANNHSAAQSLRIRRTSTSKASPGVAHRVGANVIGPQHCRRASAHVEHPMIASTASSARAMSEAPG